MGSSAEFLELIKARRSHYALKKESTISDAKIQEIIKEVVLHVPSSFNNQTTRYILLLKDEHDKFWEFVKAAIKAIVPAEAYAKSEIRLNGFKAGYGTVLFFIDKSTVAEYQKNIALYADRFPDWASETNGMSQLALWTALEIEGLGANLQHYNPLVDADVKKEWNVPETWELKAQLVFGTPSAPAGEKTFASVEDRFKVYGA